MSKKDSKVEAPVQPTNGHKDNTPPQTMEHLASIAAYRNQFRQELAALLQQNKQKLIETNGMIATYERDIADLHVKKARMEGSINLLEQLVNKA